MIASVLNGRERNPPGIVRVHVSCFVLLLAWIGAGCGASKRTGAAEVATSQSQSEGAQTATPDLKRGDSLYTHVGCNSCHSLDGRRRVGPSFQGLYGTVDHEMKDGTTITLDTEYLRESIV